LRIFKCGEELERADDPLKPFSEVQLSFVP